jgi:hypothetical protein
MRMTENVANAIRQAISAHGSASSFAAACGIERSMPIIYLKKWATGKAKYITDDTWDKMLPHLRHYLLPDACASAAGCTGTDPPRIIQDAPGDAYHAAHRRLSTRAICLALIFDSLAAAQQDAVELQIRSMELTARQTPTPTGAAHVPPAAH